MNSQSPPTTMSQSQRKRPRPPVWREDGLDGEEEKQDSKVKAKAKAKVIRLLRPEKSFLKLVQSNSRESLFKSRSRSASSVSASAFRCRMDGCHYQTGSQSNLDLHEDYQHFSWAHRQCKDNLDKIKDRLIRHKGDGGLWKCSLCGLQCDCEKDGVVHVADCHGYGLDDVPCVMEGCLFCAKHPQALKEHYKV